MDIANTNNTDIEFNVVHTVTAAITKRTINIVLSTDGLCPMGPIHDLWRMNKTCGNFSQLLLHFDSHFRSDE